ncbi:hypothetical protein A2617_03780 [Candidatus Daviesbacteria bacterium RIFOXYD1_FULL_41_10]|uniref:Uncharacterized protein n=2 Tax=Candidatus Daviesiibacteriota TaxID=1752718 RepID=A0A1F5N0D2_9BACT|nr:MAG: hypothetical protein UU67_C0003G0008 [Candidatus Daviesbacteria bacterium GW2011_GWB1_41_5]OGE70940.1 MAG: hypothetical protein A2617_03780 [Candidatus Daviesbacteria bacterium RIFOXYD1_FULL_41_10]
MLVHLDRAIEAQGQNATKKDTLYLCIAEEGLSSRVFGSSCYPHHYSSDGFIEQVAESLCFNADDVSRAVKAMRVDLVYGKREYDSALLDFLRQS